MADVILNVSLGAASSLTAGPDVLGAALALSALWISSIISYGFLYLLSTDGNSTSSSSSDSTIFGSTAMSLSTTGAKDFFNSQSDGAQKAFRSFLEGLKFGLILLIASAIITGIALFFYFQHPTLMATWGEIRQCIVRPIVDKFIYPILNVVRLLYSTVWPLVNAGRRIHHFLTSGYYKILLACGFANFTTILNAFINAKDAVISAVFAVALYLGGGLFRGERMSTLPVFTNIGAVVNYTFPILDCFCSALQPIWFLAISIPQLPALHVTGECAVGAVSRIPQLIIDPIIQFRLPSISNLTGELSCTLFSVGNFAEDLAVLIVEFFYGIYLIIEDLFSASDAAVAAVAARNETLSISASRMRIPPNVMQHLNRLPLRTLGTTWHIIGKGSVSGAASVLQFWSIFDVLELYIMLGIEALLRVLSIPWTRLATEPVVLVANILNQTIEVIMHPVEAFGQASGVRYFQIGHLGDRLRVVADTVASLLVLIDRALPCTFSMPLQVLVSVPEMEFELIREVFFATVFPPYRPGGADDCNATSCSHPAPLNWSFFDVFPAYYDWEDNRAKQSLNLLLEGGECTAYLLGCNTSALNNNATNITSNCSSAPVGCIARATNKIIVKILNGTLTFLYFVPDFLRFSADYHTFRDMPFEGLEEAVSEWVTCLSNWLDTLDENEEMCLTTTAPPDRPQPNPNQTLPADPPSNGIVTMPARASYECRLDGRAYYLDGRLVVVRHDDNVSGTEYDSDFPCEMSDSRQCAIATGTYGQILGSAPESNTTIVISPYPGASRFAFHVNVTTGTVTYGNTTLFNIDTVTVEDCTASLPLPDALPEEYACIGLNLTAVSIDLYNSQDLDYSTASLLVNGVTPLACTYTRSPRVQCPGGDAMWDGLYPIYVRPLNDDPVIDVAWPCTAGTGPITGLNCYLNMLVGVLGTPLTLLRNESITYPVFYRLPGSQTQIPIPCEMEVPAGYTCDNVSQVMSINGDPVIAVYEDATTETLNCRINQQTTAPTCTRVMLNYSDGASVTAELEGAEVRLYVNDTRFTTSCLYGSISATSALYQQSLGTHTLQDTFRTVKARVLREAGTGRNEAPRPVITTAGWEAQKLHLDSVDAARLGYYTRVDAHFETSDDPLYRKESFLCCLSETIRSIGQFVVAYVFEWVYTFRALVSLPVFPTEGFDVPTFEDARDELRNALCQLACTVTQIIPVTFSCPGMQSSAGCSTGASCARNLLCDLFNVPLLFVDIIVDILRTIKALTQNESSSEILSDDCLQGDFGSCFVSFLVYCVTKVLFTITLVFRGVAGFLDCVLCALIRIGDGSFYCVPVIYAFVDAVADLIDGIGAQLLTSVLNFIVGIIEVIVYFFSGQFGKLITALFEKVFASIGEFFLRVGDLILQFLLKLPVVGDIIRVLFEIIEGACSIINDIVMAFGGADINCPDLDAAKKRSIGWMDVWPNVTYAWQSGQPMHTACLSRMEALNATSLVLLTASERQEFMYCTAAHLWLLDEANGNETFTTSCDVLMRDAYSAGTAWSALGLSKGTVLECLEARLRMEAVRSKESRAYSWVPHDLLYNKKRWVQLVDDAWLAYDVWNQYAQDRNTPANVLVSSSYRAHWQAQGFSVAHLDSLASTAITASDVYSALDSNSGSFSLASYATRAVASPPRFSRQLLRRQYDGARIAGIANTLWRRVMNGTDTEPSIFGYVIEAEWDRVASQMETASLSVPFTAATLPAMAMANDTRLLSLSMGGLVNVFSKDIPAMVAYLTRTTNTTSPLKRTLDASISLPYYLLRAGYGGILLAREWLNGKAMANALWLSDPVTQQWLHEHGETVVATGGALHQTSAASALHYVTNRVYGAITAIIPKAEPLHHMAALFTHATLSTTSAAASRRASVSTLFSRSLLAISHALETPSYEVRKKLIASSPSAATLVDPGTGIECLLLIDNGTDIIAPLCETGLCLYLDQLLGTVVDSITDLFNYYEFVSERCRLYPNARACRVRPNMTGLPTITRSFARYNAFTNYTFNDDAAVQIGPYVSHGVQFPWRDQPDLDLLADTDSKIRFTDIEDLWNATVFFFQDAVGVQFGSIGIAASTAAPYSNLTYTNTSASFGRNAATVSMEFFHKATVWWLGDSPAKVTVAATSEFQSIADVVITWADFFYATTFKCSYQSELDGSMKRFAIGETVLIMLIASIVLSFVLYGLGVSSFLSTFVNIGGMFPVLFLAGFLVVTYNWSYRCTPAMPVSLADDLFAFIVFVLFPKAPLFGALSDQVEYTNLTCYACSRWRDKEWTFPSFTRSLQSGGRFGFEDLSFNIVFTLKHYFPGLLTDIREMGPTLPFIGSLFDVDIVKARLGAYDFYNRSALTEKAHSQFVGGNWLTIFINLGVLALILALAYVLSDLIAYLVQFIRSLLLFVGTNVIVTLIAFWAIANLTFSPGGIRPPRDTTPVMNTRKEESVHLVMSYDSSSSPL